MNQMVTRPEGRSAAPATPDDFARNVLVSGGKLTLPKHINQDRFERNLITAIQQHPKLLQCPPHTVFAEVAKAATLGLYFDPTLGEAYLITGGGYGNVPLLPQLRIGYRGLIKLCRQSGEIARVSADSLCENDDWYAVKGTEHVVRHVPAWRTGRGKEQAYWACVTFRDGTVDYEVMTMAEIEKIRDRSDGWKAYRGGKIKSTPWSTDPEEMSKKTVLRRLLKRIPMSPELADAIRIEDADYSHDATPLPQTGLKAALANRQAAQIAAPVQEGFSVAVETIEGELASAQETTITTEYQDVAAEAISEPVEAEDEPDHLPEPVTPEGRSVLALLAEKAVAWCSASQRQLLCALCDDAAAQQLLSAVRDVFKDHSAAIRAFNEPWFTTLCEGVVHARSAQIEKGS